MTDLPPSATARDALTTVLLGHNAFQYMRAAVELGLFEFLAREPGAGRERIAEELDLQDRAVDILLLGVASLHLVDRTEARGPAQEPLRTSS